MPLKGIYLRMLLNYLLKRCHLYYVMLKGEGKGSLILSHSVTRGGRGLVQVNVIFIKNHIQYIYNSS